MTLSELLFALRKPDWTPKKVDVMKLEVTFSTEEYSHLSLLGVYYASVDKKIVIDIG